MGKWFTQRIVSYIVLYCFAMGIIAAILFNRYETNTNEYIQDHVVEFDQRMKNFQSMQQKMIDSYYALFLDSDKITAIMEKAADSGPSVQQELRRNLMGQTEAMFASLKNFDVRLLFFHLPGQIAFLRLHKPEQFGDSLAVARPGIAIAQKTQQKVVAFETGKIFDGFRTVYPLFHHGRFVGTVEIAYPFIALKKQALNQVDGAYTFLIKRSIQEGKSKAPVIAAYYQKSPFGTEYIEDKESSLMQGAKGFENGELTALISLNREKIQKALKEEKLQGIPLPYNGKYALLVLKPIKEVNGRHAAYMVEITPDHTIFTNERNQLIELLISIALLLALLMWYVYRYQRSTLILEQYKQAIDEGMIVSKTDRQGIITYVNQRFIDISGYGEEELMGSPHRIIRHPDSPSELFRVMWDTIRKGKIWHGTIQNRRKDGRSYYVKSTICPILDENGQIIEYIGLREDITQLIETTKREEKLRIEAQRSESAKMEFLANMSHEIRTPLNGIMGFAKLLSDADLPPLSHRHAEIIREQGKTLMGVINDILDLSKIESGNLTLEKVFINPYVELENAFSLFTPVAVEQGINYTIRLDNALRENIGMDVLRLKQVMSNLISNALKFTPKGGSIGVDVEVVQMSALQQRLRFSVTDTGIGIAEEKLNTIFSPFVQEDNSTTRRYGGTGLGLSISLNLVQLFGGELRVESKKGEGSRFWFEMDVEIGNEKDNLSLRLSEKRVGLIRSEDEHVTRVKQQLDTFGVTYAEYDREEIATLGIPLDIAIVFDETTAKKLAGDASGNVREIVVIANTDGTEYPEKITWIDDYDHCPSRLYTVLRSKAMDEIRHQVPRTSVKNGWKNKRVLVVDDYEVNRILLAALLEVYGILPEFAENGEEACKKVEQERYDLVFMDINMPVMDGLEATRVIRGQYPDLPIIALTANALEGDRERFIGAGMNGYLSKPINMKELFRLMRDFLGSEVSEGEKEESVPPSILQDWYAEAKKALKVSDELIVRLFDLFEQSLPERLNALKEGIANENPSQVELQAHTIKGGAGNLCLKRMSDIAGEIEAIARKGEVNGCEKLFDALDAEYQLFSQELAKR